MQRFVLFLTFCLGLSLLGVVGVFSFRLLRAAQARPLRIEGPLATVVDIDVQLRRFLEEVAELPPTTELAYRVLRVRVEARAGEYAVLEALATVRAGGSEQVLSIERGLVFQRAVHRRAEGDDAAPGTWRPAAIRQDLPAVVGSLPRRGDGGGTTYDLTLAVDGVGLRWMIADERGIVGYRPADVPEVAGPTVTPPPVTTDPDLPEDWL